MAVDFDVKGTRTSEYGFLPEELDVQPDLNGRYELPDIQWLIDSILTHGQLQCVTIRRTGGKPVLVAGFSRWRAVSEINKKGLTEKPLRVRCSYTALTEKQAFLANIEENRVRNATTPIDDAHNIQRLITVYQLTEDEVAINYRESKAWVKGRLQLIELVPEAEKAVRDGRVVGAAAKAIAKLTREQQRAVLKQEGKITVADVRRESGTPEKPAKADIKAIARKVFDSVEVAALEDTTYKFVEVDRKKLLALYRALNPTT